MITNPEMATGLAALTKDLIDGIITESAFATSLQALFDDWNQQISTGGLAARVGELRDRYDAKWSAFLTLTVKGIKNVVADLPPSGNTDGDLWWVKESTTGVPFVGYPYGQAYVWITSAWIAQGSNLTKGQTGAAGATGATGATGVGIPTGGTTGQALIKASGTNYDTTWGTPVASAAWGGITGTLSSQTDLQTALNARLNVASPAATGTLSLDTDVKLLRDATNVLAIRNGTTAQGFRSYNTYTDASNYERAILSWSANVLEIGSEKAGTGATRAISFKVGGTAYWGINTSGHLIASTDATSDIGQSGANRPRHIYLSGDVSPGASGALVFAGRSKLTSASDGVLLLSNNAASDFTRLQFGGTTSSFPALKRSSTGIQVRLADDSAFGNFSVGGLQVGMVTKTGAYTATINDHTILCDTTSAGFTVGLYTAVGNAGRRVTIKKIASANTLVIDPNSTETADGASTISLTTQYDSVTLESDGTNWVKVGQIASAVVGSVAWGAITGTLSSQSDLQTALNAKAPTASPSFTTSITLDSDVILVRAAANTLSLRNGTNAQNLYVSNTYTDASNYERAVFGWTSNALKIGTANAGTGSARALDFITGGTARWTINTSGHFVAGADNTYDIGQSGATRPRHIYTGGNIVAGGILTSAGRIVAITTKTGAYTLTGNDDTVLGDTTSAGFTLTLPTAVGRAGQEFMIAKMASANTLTVATTSSQTINGKTTYALLQQYDTLRVVSDGSNWLVVSAFPLEVIGVALSDETTAITTGTAKITWHMAYAFRVVEIYGGLSTVGGSQSVFDVKAAGTSIMTTNKINLDTGVDFSTGSATQPTLTTTDLAKGTKMTGDIVTAGSSAKGAKVYLVGFRLR